MKEEVIGTVDVGATKIAVAISIRKGILARRMEPTVLRGVVEAVPRQVTGLIERCLAEGEIDRDRLKAVGISSAGPFLKRDGMIELVCPNMCGGLAPERGILPNSWKSIPFEKVLRESFEQIVIENDAVAGAVAERRFCSGPENMIYVTWSTGIGTGAFVDGRLIRGKNGNAPHGGHIYLGLEGPTCGCGNIGDLEGWTSGTSIADRYGDGVTTAEVFERYRSGDVKAIEIVDRAALYFAKGLASLNAVLDTSLIVIGGSVFLNNQDLLLPVVRNVFYQSFPLLSEEVRIEPAGLGEHLGDVAAISLVIPEEWVEDWKVRKPWKAPINKIR